ncbi:hypothetical protein EDD85DRAFT_98877 [Armillaria nabsnona]|nr:hypothetical protein EDD85DRAFT_98877 [Armillaria nabsnona]
MAIFAPYTHDGLGREGHGWKCDDYRATEVEREASGGGGVGPEGKCDPDLCEGLVRLYDFTKWRSQKEHARYKYYFDVDGNAWSGRFKWLLSSLALICSSTMAVDVSPPSPPMNILEVHRPLNVTDALNYLSVASFYLL